ncbi:LuxE/PaaK family acyltransferase [Fibrella arboris]|uniref:LuxE/PaaK family acyltransferase n=1 Tax=Fibrella arboris TaxID=3242486 RepID=UPI0035202061
MQATVFLSQSDWRSSLRQRILNVTATDFDALALELFQYQARYNNVYADYLGHLRCKPGTVRSIAEIPFLPISFFKTHRVLIPDVPEATEFASSGTTGATTSRHVVPDLPLYDAVCQRLFEEQYGPLSQFHILGLLPSYLERNNSSLVYMVQRFMTLSGADQSGFFLNNHAELTTRLRQLTERANQRTQDDSSDDPKKVLLIGVTFGLLDWIDQTPESLEWVGDHPDLIVMETGGMKGRRREMLREEVHAELIDKLGVSAIHSEYGMTELLSQAYSSGHGVFRPGATIQVRLRDLNDPFHSYVPGNLLGKQTGGVNVIDLANLDSCAFIETQDLGQYDTDPGTFRIMGRFDNADVRGCNLLVAL